MKTDTPKAIRLSDYAPPAYQTLRTHLTFALEEDATTVTNRMEVERQPHASNATLELDGEGLELVSVSLGEQPLAAGRFEQDEGTLRIFDLGEHAEITVVTRIYPQKNTALEGLYVSSGMYCTQCEAQGFRKITYFQDRPDVSAKYTTTIIADATRFPVLLSNGNLVEEKVVDGGRRLVTWQDPFPKPSYLFALVAGNLDRIEDTFTTMSGREVQIHIYSEAHNIDECHYAMDALKRSMRWDEEVFGREYDLDIFMVVAVDDFNMGAMENKGLNIFNTSCVLASSDTATDARYQRVEGVVAHEYFHNWSGNRVTCRDWFQLSLKEGFTVYRDAEFSSDMNSRPVKRNEDVQALRDQQFPEDAGPLAHAVRPDSYVEISNFYTRTVYEKGAEVVRMLATLLGPERFRRGSDLYFERHDGSAATTDDFLAAMQEVCDVDLSQFQRWYEQAGTPVLHVTQSFAAGTLKLSVAQSCPPTPGQATKEPFLVPIEIGLVDAQGDVLSDAVAVRSAEHVVRRGRSLLVHMRKPQAELEFTGLSGKPAVSFLRGFTAPVKIEFDRSGEELDTLIQYDSDGFCRWDAARMRSLAQMLHVMNGQEVSGSFLSVYASLGKQAVQTSEPEAALLLAQLLTLPGEVDLFSQLEPVDVERACEARDTVRRVLGEKQLPLWHTLYERHAPRGSYQPDRQGNARRALCRVALDFIAAADDGDVLADLLEAHYRKADNLTDRLMALELVVREERIDHRLRQKLLQDFLEQWKSRALVVDEWFGLQARSPLTDVSALASLEAHEYFNIRNPNKVRALFRDFATHNHRRFHAADGSGYVYVADKVATLDAINPQVAARLARAFSAYRDFDSARQTKIRVQLERLAARPNLSKDVYEVVTKSLQSQ